MADFMRIKYENSRMKQSEKANQLGNSTSNLQRWRNDIFKLSPYRIPSNNTNKRAKKILNSNFNNNSRPDSDVKRPQLTTNDRKTNTKSIRKNKKTLKAESIHENFEINDEYLDEILDNIDK